MNVPITFDIRVVEFDKLTPNPSGGWHSKDLKPGAAWWTRYNAKITHLYFCCPCGCGDVFSVPVRYPKTTSESDGWEWDGDEVHPTLTPSIRRLTGCMWHGHLTKGVFDSV